MAPSMFTTAVAAATASRRRRRHRRAASTLLSRSFLLSLLLSASLEKAAAAAPPAAAGTAPAPRSRRRVPAAPLNAYLRAKDAFDVRRRAVEGVVFRSRDAFAAAAPMEAGAGPPAPGATRPSRMYGYAAFFESLRSLAVDGVRGRAYHVRTRPYVPGGGGPGNEHAADPDNDAFYVNQDAAGSDGDGLRYAIVNICAFLATAMIAVPAPHRREARPRARRRAGRQVEAIQFDTCEELNGMPRGGAGPGDGDGGARPGAGRRGLASEVSAVHGRYFPLANACGVGRLYQGADEEGACADMACPAAPDLEVTAAPHPRYNFRTRAAGPGPDARGPRTPPPLRCRPRDDPADHAGYWDGHAAAHVRRVAYPSALGQTSVEGCCWWGRGALMTRGTCGLGRINYWLGKRAYDEGRPSRYPNIDFCKSPGIICGENTVQFTGSVYPELKYTVALFEWIDRVQSHSDAQSDWDYLAQLKRFVDGGLERDAAAAFMDATSSVVARGCAGPRCSARTIPFLAERRRHFATLLYDVFDLQGRPPPPPAPPAYDFAHAMSWLHAKRSRIEGNVLVARTRALGGVPYYSRAYRFEPLLAALQTTAYFGFGEFGDHMEFFLYDEEQGQRGFHAGLVNLAFFLANAMAESIANDSCNEIHWEKSGGGYAVANSCGQNGRDYGSETCPEWQSFMTCGVDKEAEIRADTPVTAVPPFMVDGASQLPPPFQCRAGTDPAGYWDEGTRTVYDDTFENSFGRTDVEGCCFWGRGVLSTRGSCNYGKLNFYLGAQAAAEGRPSAYPDIDFCTGMDAICSEKSMELRYVVGMFEYIERVQDYYDSTLNWSYKEELYKFVDNGMDNDAFVDAVSNIVVRGCHLSDNYPCSATTYATVDTNRFLYGRERRTNFKNIIRLVFELPIAARPAGESSEIKIVPLEIQTITKPPTFSPSSEPMPSPATDPGPVTSSRPTGSPVEFSDLTQYNNGGSYTINGEVTDESVLLSRNTTLVLEQGGKIEAPLNTDWPAVRISTASTFIGKGGILNGSYAELGGECIDGGDAIHVNNGQSSPETASYAEFYDGMYVIGGDAPGGVGGNALYVNGFGTTAIINGGTFKGGQGSNDDDYNGFSIYVLNSAEVHIRSGIFQGEMKVERNGKLRLYGCFRKHGTKVTGTFVDGTYLDVSVKTYYGGEVMLISVSEQECETAPSSSPTSVPGISRQPTGPRPNGGSKNGVRCGFTPMVAFTLLHYLMDWAVSN